LSTNDEPLISDDTPRPARSRNHAPLPTGVAAGTPVAAAPAVAETFAEEDSRTRAARRSAELMEHIGELDGQDEFAIDARVIPDGWSYEWKRHTILNKEDPSYQVSLARTGWEAVPAYRHPEMMPEKYTGETIERKGMILMERPLQVTNMVKQQELRKARVQVRDKETQLTGAPAGPNSPFENTNAGKPINTGIRKSYEAIPIPKE
jgi:hypothetical protein